MRDLTPEEARLVASWDRDLDALAGELRRARATVHRRARCRATLTASQLLRLAADPDGFARELARPMPRPPAARRAPRHPLPRLGRVPLRGADAAACSARTSCRRRGRRRDRRRARPGGAQGRLRAHAVRPPHPLPRRGALPARPSRAASSAAGSTPSTGSPADGDGDDVRDRRLEDRPLPGRRPPPAGRLPARLGRAARTCRCRRSRPRSSTSAAARSCAPRSCPAGPELERILTGETERRTAAEGAGGRRTARPTMTVTLITDAEP